MSDALARPGRVGARPSGKASFPCRRAACLALCLALALFCAPPPALCASGTPAASPAAPASSAPSPSPASATSADAPPLPTPAPSPVPSPTPQPVTWQNLALVPAEQDMLKEGALGDDVVRLQLRLKDLGFFSYKVTGSFGGVTKSAVQAFQAANGLKIDGVAGGETIALLYSNLAQRGFGNRARVTPTPSPKPVTPPQPGRLIEWKDAAGLVKPGETFTIIDFRTGISWKERRLGGDNHLDSEPLTKADTAKLKQVYGGRFSWSRRPVLVKVGSRTYAASINGYPHDPYRVKDNNYPGHHCVHFLNSRTHGTNTKDPEHQRCIKTAAGL